MECHHSTAIVSYYYPIAYGNDSSKVKHSFTPHKIPVWNQSRMVFPTRPTCNTGQRNAICGTNAERKRIAQYGATSSEADRRCWRECRWIAFVHAVLLSKYTLHPKIPTVHCLNLLESPAIASSLDIIISV